MDSCNESRTCSNHSSVAPLNEANADRIREIDRVQSGTPILYPPNVRRISLGFFNAACWCPISIYMNERFRVLAFAVLLIGISSVTLVQVIHTSAASVSGATDIDPVALRDMILQNVNTTSTSNQTLSPASTVFANSTTENTTSTLETASLTQSSSSATNETTAISYLQYQMTSVNAELAAMSSRMDSMSQDNNTAMLIAEAGLIVGILAVVAAIAVARRADAMYKESSKDQAAGSSPPTK